MSNRERLRRVFREAFELDSGAGTEFAVDVEKTAYRATPEWDSVRHMQLVAAIEIEFDVMLETDDILNMSSFAKAMEILERSDVDMGT
jgi:acyl carrier protein